MLQAIRTTIWQVVEKNSAEPPRRQWCHINIQYMCLQIWCCSNHFCKEVLTSTRHCKSKPKRNQTEIQCRKQFLQIKSPQQIGTFQIFMCHLPNFHFKLNNSIITCQEPKNDADNTMRQELNLSKLPTEDSKRNFPHTTFQIQQQMACSEWNLYNPIAIISEMEFLIHNWKLQWPISIKHNLNTHWHNPILMVLTSNKLTIAMNLMNISIYQKQKCNHVNPYSKITCIKHLMNTILLHTEWTYMYKIATQTKVVNYQLLCNFKLGKKN